MNLLSIFVPKPREQRFLCMFEFPVTIRYEHCRELASALGNPSVDPHISEIREHKLKWDKPTFARDDIDDELQMIQPFVKSITVKSCDRRYMPAELATVQRSSQKLFVSNLGGGWLGYFGGVATSIEQAVHWIETGHGLAPLTWQGAP